MEHLLPRRAELLTSGPNDWWLPSSNYTRQLYLRAGVDPGRMDISYYGPDIAAFQTGDGSKIRTELGLPESTKLVAMVAYFYAPKRWLGQTRGLKGHEDLIDAAALLVNEGRDLTVLFVGSAWGRSGEYEESVKRYAAGRLGARAVFLGLRRDVQDIYAAADLSVAPSYSENLGSPVESLAAGVPTIASRAGGLVEVVQHERTGLVFEPRNPADLAEKLAWMLDHPDQARKWAEAGREWIETHLPIEVAALQIGDFYRRILDAQPRKTASTGASRRR
jgi:glycosyltransferase involved in cell wall biosynthesis